MNEIGKVLAMAVIAAVANVIALWATARVTEDAPRLEIKRKLAQQK